MDLSRRSVLKLGAGATALWVAGARLAKSEPQKKRIPIGLQLYSLRTVVANDVPGMLDAVAKMGYEGVEFAGYYGRTAKDLRKLLDRSGLKCCGTHLGLASLEGDAFQREVDFNKALGNKYLIVSGLPHANMASVAALVDTAKLLTELAQRAKVPGMRVGYHAHPGDFRPVEGRAPWEVIFSHAGADVVMQLDTGNCREGGGDPVAVLKKFPHRSATIHLKEFGGAEGAVIGEGGIPWQQIFALCEATGDTQWYIVEQEVYRQAPLESVKLCLENLRKIRK